jgi:hypothetical protein
VSQVDDANIAWRKAGIAHSVRRLLTDMLKHVCQVSPHMPDLPVSDAILDTVVVLLDATTQQQVSKVRAIQGLDVTLNNCLRSQHKAHWPYLEPQQLPNCLNNWPMAKSAGPIHLEYLHCPRCLALWIPVRTIHGGPHG